MRIRPTVGACRRFESFNRNGQNWLNIYIYIYIVILPSSWWGSGAAMATLRPSSWNPRSFQWVSIHVNEQVTTPQNLAFAMQQNVEGLFISFSYLLHLGNLFPCIQYTSIETLECVQCVHVGSPVKKEFRRIEARQTARPSGSSDKKHGCGSPNLEILMEKNSCERVGDIPLPCYMNVCLPEGMLSSTLYIDWLLRSKHVPGFCVWHLEENTLQPKWNSLGVPILGNFHMYIYIYCDLLWFIEIYAEIFGVYVYIYIYYIHMFPPLKDTCPIPANARSLSGSDPSMDFDSARAPTQANDAGRLDETHGPWFVSYPPVN